MRILITGGSGFFGVNAVEILAKDHQVFNLDINSPLQKSQRDYWRSVDIMNPEQLRQAFAQIQPEWVLHLAARTDCEETVSVEQGYAVNTVGTQNVLDAIKETPSVQKVVVVSSQYICGPAHQPKDDQDFAPHTVYGQSKVLAEQYTREAGLSCCWTIIRPVNIWGPWHMRYRREFWRVVKKGWYFHPGGSPVVRCYGYVGNVVDQIDRIFKASPSRVNQQVFYVGDPPIDIYEWTNAFSLALTGRPVRRVPRALLRVLGWVGDLFGLVGGKFPITSSRYNSMTTDYVPDMNRTFEVLGSCKFTLEEGVRKTVEWLDHYHD